MESTSPWSVPREWAGETAFIVAGGPSLRKMNLRPLKGRHVIVINNSWELVPDAEVLYFCDTKWWQQHGERVKKDFQGKYCVTIAHCPDDKLLRLDNTGRHGLEILPTGLRHGTNSGYQAINLAYHFGASRIVLLGYDMKIEGAQTHWHAGHGRPVDHFEHHVTKNMLPKFDMLVLPLQNLNVEVWNATPGSALKCWPAIDLMELL